MGRYRAPASAPSLRAQRSNPDCHRRGILDCFAALAMTWKEPGLPCRARDLLRRRHFRRRNQTLQLGNAGAAIGAGLELGADLGGCARSARDRIADGAAADAEAGAD